MSISRLKSDHIICHRDNFNQRYVLVRRTWHFGAKCPTRTEMPGRGRDRATVAAALHRPGSARRVNVCAEAVLVEILGRTLVFRPYCLGNMPRRWGSVWSIDLKVCCTISSAQFRLLQGSSFLRRTSRWLGLFRKFGGSDSLYVRHGRSFAWLRSLRRSRVLLRQNKGLASPM